MANQRQITIVVTENKGFLITVSKKVEVKTPEGKEGMRINPYIPFTDALYIASGLDEVMVIVREHTEVMFKEKE